MQYKNDEQIAELLGGVDHFLNHLRDENNTGSSAAPKYNPHVSHSLYNKVFDEKSHIGEPPLDGMVELTVTDDEMEVTADFYPPRGEGLPVTITILERFLQDREISYGVKWQKIKETIFTCNTERIHIPSVIIAEGTESIPEIPEHLEILPELTEYEETELRECVGCVDYREISPFVIVEKGQVIALKKPESPGISGYTVKGKMIPFTRKKIQQPKPGKNTAERGNEVIASCHGRFMKKKSDFWVSEVLDIITDVDYHTGHIDFPGDVVIHGQIKDRFRIKAEGSIYCKSTLDASEVECAGDLIVEQGIIGRKDGKVKVGGRVQAKFIENCSVESKGKIVVKTGIMNSEIDTLDTLEMGPRGTVIGGKITALNRIQVMNAGNANGTVTEMVCGVDFSVQKKLIWIKEQGIKLVEAQKKVLENLKHANAKSVEELKSMQQEIDEKKHLLHEAAIPLLDKLDKNEDAEVLVQQNVYPGLQVEICHNTYVADRRRQRMRFYLDKNKGKIDTERI